MFDTREKNSATTSGEPGLNLNDPQSWGLLINNLRDKGYAVITNHGVPTHFLAEIFEQWGIFFTNKDKYNYLRADETDEGFIPVNFETAKKGETADYKELFQTHYGQKFPTTIDTTLTIRIFDSLIKLGERIVTLIENELPASIKNQMPMRLTEMTANSNNHFIRIIHYPPIEKDTRIPRAAPHTDICLFTLVFGSAFRGLEFKHHDGSWFAPNVGEENIVIFNSEMLEICTNGYFKAMPHCVKADLNSHSKSRFSIPFAFHPLRQALLRENLTAGKYVQDRLTEMGYMGYLLDIQNQQPN